MQRVWVLRSGFRMAEVKVPDRLWSHQEVRLRKSLLPVFIRVVGRIEFLVAIAPRSCILAVSQLVATGILYFVAFSILKGSGGGRPS